MSQLPVPEIQSQRRRFKVALSFPGEHREYVKEVAAHLVNELGEDTVFYDMYFEHELARMDLDLYLMSIYKDQAELVAIFFCEEYDKKDWCKLEWRAVRQMIKDKRAHEIMPFKLNEFEIDGFLGLDGYIDVQSRNSKVIADLIVKRLKSNYRDIDAPIGLRKSNHDHIENIAINIVDTHEQQYDYYTIEDNGLPILDYIHDLFAKIYDELNFIPTSILEKIYPFKINAIGYTDYRSFNLTTNNTALFDFFASINRNESQELNFSQNELLTDPEKTKEVAKKLTQNLIFNIGDSKKTVSIYYREDNHCECIQCNFDRLKFHKVFKDLSSISPSNLKDQLKIGYIHYKIGNDLLAKDIYDNVSKNAKQQGKKLIYFIAQFNLSKLANFIRTHYWGVNSQHQVIDELSKIDIGKISESLNKSGPNKLFDFIEKIEFFNIASNGINETVCNLVDDYYFQLDGGVSHNSHITELTCQFAELESFLNANHILYDEFYEFEKLFARIIEGLFASHAIDKNKPSRLNALDDYWISKIIFYGSKDSIIKYFRRYKLKEINYQKTSTENDSFFDLAKNFLENVVETKENFLLYCEKTNTVFIKRYNQIFQNILTLAAVLNINSETINDITKLLVSFIEKENIINWPHFESIDIFISNKAKQINIEYLEQMFLLTFSRPKLHRCDFILSLLQQIDKRGKINLSNENINLFVQRCFDKCDVCNSVHQKDNLFFLYNALNTKGKKNIKGKIEHHLIDKFDPELFYLAIIFNVIPFNEGYFIQYFEHCNPKEGQNKLQKDFWGRINHSTAVDDFINLCFKQKIDLTDNRFDKMRIINPYYSWLLDMDNFDYSDFDPEWILYYNTIHYINAMKKSKKLINELKKQLKENSNPRVERKLLRFLL